MVKRSFRIILILLLSFCFAKAGFADAIRSWDAQKGFADWKIASPDTMVSMAPSGMIIDSQNVFPVVMSPTYLGVILDDYDLLIIKMTASKGGTANIFWADYQNPNFDRQRIFAFYLGSPGRQKTYYIDLSSQDKGWLRRADALLINPFPGPGSCEIGSVSIERSNLITKAIAGWQEFWGPRGRMIIGSTINTMQSPNIFGTSVYYYVYWLLAIFFVLALIYSSYRWFIGGTSGNLWSVVKNALFRTLVLAFAFWCLLEASNLVTQINNAKDDFYLFGKSLDEKRQLINNPDFYDFICFCQKAIPNDEPFDLVAPFIYDDIKFRYYLYPHPSVKGSKYVVVFNGTPDADLIKTSKLFAKYKDNAYILEKL